MATGVAFLSWCQSEMQESSGVVGFCTAHGTMMKCISNVTNTVILPFVLIVGYCFKLLYKDDEEVRKRAEAGC
jgi:hypothetical protein